MYIYHVYTATIYLIFFHSKLLVASHGKIVLFFKKKMKHLPPIYKTIIYLGYLNIAEKSILLNTTRIG